MRIAIRWVALLFVSLAACLMLSLHSVAYASDEEPLVFFVVSAPSGEIDEGVITLRGVPAVIYFSERSDHRARHVHLSDFVEWWPPLKDQQDDPPNAALSILAASAESQATVFKVLAMKASGQDLVLVTEPLESVLPNGTFGAASIFFDGLRADPTKSMDRCLANCN